MARLIQLCERHPGALACLMFAAMLLEAFARVEGWL